MAGSKIPPYNILIGATGSVAAIKIPHLIDELQLLGRDQQVAISIRVVATTNALKFFDQSSLQNPVNVYCDENEWKEWKTIGDPIMHIEMRRWADLFVIAPLDANTLAKMACGLCDNLLTCIARAWDSSKPLLFCPAMNTLMWNHPVTAGHISTLKSFGYIEIPPISKKLACGDDGIGAMADVKDIARTVWNYL